MSLTNHRSLPNHRPNIHHHHVNPNPLPYHNHSLAHRDRKVESKSENDRKNRVTFFFTNFPLGWRKDEMIRTFRRIGEVNDVFVPHKKDARGNGFGFVRFIGVKDVKELEDKLNLIWLGSYKLRANIPRFNRHQKEQKMNTIPTPNPKPLIISKQARRDSRTFAEVVYKEENQTRSLGPVVTFEFTSSEESRKWAEECYVGALRTPNCAAFIQSTLSKGGFQSIRILKAGHNTIIMKADCKKDMEDLLKEEYQWFESWFEWIHPWDSRAYRTERRCWIKCFGIPIHAWEPRFFHKIAAALGSLIECDRHTTDKDRVDFARLLISTKESFPIIKSLNILVDGLLLEIKIVEEEFIQNEYGHEKWEKRFQSESSSEDSSPESDEDSFIPDTEDGEARNFENLEALTIGSKHDRVEGSAPEKNVAETPHAKHIKILSGHSGREVAEGIDTNLFEEMDFSYKNADQALSRPNNYKQAFKEGEMEVAHDHVIGPTSGIEYMKRWAIRTQFPNPGED
ncbi:hypothetical protein DH2020_019619 [Rehmannia glutinosa]|uniref:RRM domain-containing protein n=1 Tax=Rehmannia glutinosa TaxID=99300 RepID=A0ABR0WHY6_REHGL